MKSMWARLNSSEAPEAMSECYVFVMLTLFPLFTGFKAYANITLSKFLFFVISSAIWLTALVLARGRFPQRRQLSAPMKWMLAFLCLCCLSALLSPHRAESFWGAGRYDGLFSWLLYGGVFLACCAHGHWKPWHSFGFAVAVGLCSLVAIGQLMGHDPLGLYPGDLNFYDGHVRYIGQFLGTVGNTNLLSSVLCLAIAYGAGHILSAEERPSALWLVSMGLAMFVLTASGVSGGLLALAMGGAVACVWLLDSQQRLCRGFGLGAVLLGCAGLALAFQGSAESWRFVFERKSLLMMMCSALSLSLCLFLCVYSGPFPPAQRLRRGWLLVLLFSAVGLLALLWFWEGEQGTLYEFSQILRGNFDDRFGSSRLRIWKRCLALAKERPLLGHGPGTLALVMDIEFSRVVDGSGRLLSSTVDNAHNVYLQILCESGLLGLAAYGGILLSSLRLWYRQRHSSRTQALGLAVVCYAIQSFFNLELCLNAPLFWIFLGLFVSEIISSSYLED